MLAEAVVVEMPETWPRYYRKAKELCCILRIERRVSTTIGCSASKKKICGKCAMWTLSFQKKSVFFLLKMVYIMKEITKYLAENVGTWRVTELKFYIISSYAKQNPQLRFILNRYLSHTIPSFSEIYFICYTSYIKTCRLCRVNYNGYDSLCSFMPFLYIHFAVLYKFHKCTCSNLTYAT